MIGSCICIHGETILAIEEEWKVDLATSPSSNDKRFAMWQISTDEYCEAGGRRMTCHCVLVGFDKCMGDYRCEEEEE